MRFRIHAIISSRPCERRIVRDAGYENLSHLRILECVRCVSSNFRPATIADQGRFEIAIASTIIAKNLLLVQGGDPFF